MATPNNSKKPTIPVPNILKTDSTAPNPTTENTMSMVFGGVVVGTILLLAVSFWRDWRNNQEAPAEETGVETQTELVEVEELPAGDSVVVEVNDNGEQIPVNLPAKYTVKSGDSSWKIAQAFYGSGFNYVDIETENGLTPDSDLTIGQELTIPKVAVRQTAGGRAAGEYTSQPTATPSTEPTAAKGDTTAETAELEGKEE